MSPRRPLLRRTLRIAGLASVVLAGAGCGENFDPGARTAPVVLESVNWADTMVIGETRRVAVRVRDQRTREVIGAGVEWSATDAAVLQVTSSATANGIRTGGADSLTIVALTPGTASVAAELDDPRFTGQPITRQVVVVTGGVRLTSSRDTTMTALGDTAVLRATAVGHDVMGGLVDRAGMGVTWTHRGTAVALSGTGDQARVVAQGAGTDTLVATHDLCAAGARCADTVVVRVQQAVTMTLDQHAFRAWSLGDTARPAVSLGDRRGSGVAGATLRWVPLTAADTATVSIGAAATLADGAALVGPSPALEALPLVARANGLARLQVQAVSATGSVLATDTVTVTVRQVAATVRATTHAVELTAGDSLPVRFAAYDARGREIADAVFETQASGVQYDAAGRQVATSASAGAGNGVVIPRVVGAASAATHGGQGAPTAPPVVDTVKVAVTVPPQATAGTDEGEPLRATVLESDGRPAAGTWVRFVVPAGTVTPDSVLTDANGVARATWHLPTGAGNYTATVVRLDKPIVNGDSTGAIVSRRSATITPAAPAKVRVATDVQGTLASGATFANPVSAQLLDEFGNVVRQAGATVAVRLVRQDSSAATGVATLVGAATAATDAEGVAMFAGLGIAGAQGDYRLELSLGGAHPVLSSVVALRAGRPAPSRTTVVLSAAQVRLAEVVTAVVTPRDIDGNIAGPGHQVLVGTAGANGESYLAPEGAVVDNGDGTYTVRLLATRVGTPVPLQLSVDGETAALAEPTIEVLPGAPAALEFLTAPATYRPFEPVTVRLRATDLLGNPVAGARVRLSLQPGTAGDLDGQQSVELVADAAGEVTFEGWHPGTRVGTYHLAATAGDAQASFQATIEAGKAALSRTILTISKATVKVGEVVEVTMTPRDTADNLLGAGHAASAGMPRMIGESYVTNEGETIDNGDGTYTVRLKGDQVGVPRMLYFGVDGTPQLFSDVVVTVVPGDPASIEVVAGDELSAVLGQATGTRPSVVVRDVKGNAIPGVEVFFHGPSAGGTIGGGESQVVVTDELGRATAGEWVLGASLGTQELLVKSGTAQATFRATATSGEPVVGEPAPSRTQVMLYATRVRAGEFVGVRITLRDTNDLVVGAGHQVQVRTAAGPGLSHATPESDAGFDGQDAYATRLLGVTPGAPAAIEVIVDGEPVRIDGLQLEVTAGEPASLDVTLGANATAKVGTAVPVELVVRDANGFPVPGVPVRLRINPAAGNLIDGGSELTVVSNADGVVATSAWTPGTAVGIRVLFAEYGTLSAQLQATLEAGEPASMQIIGGDAQVGYGEAELPMMVRARLFDGYGNPVPNAWVSFVPDHGGSLDGKPSGGGLTDADGVREAGVWTLGPQLGTQELLVSYSESIRTVVKATAISKVALSRTLVQPERLSVPEGEFVNVLVTPRDTNDQDLGPGLRVEAGMPEAYFIPWGPTVDNGDGTYTVPLRASQVGGPAALHVTIDGRDLAREDVMMVVVADIRIPALSKTMIDNRPDSVRLGEQFYVYVTPVDTTGRTVGSGHAVTLSVEDRVGGGLLSVVGTWDNGNGSYTVELRAERIGAATPLRVTVDGESAELAAHAIKVLPGYPMTMEIVAGSEQTGYAGAALPIRPKVRVLDQAGNPIPNEPVHFYNNDNGTIDGAWDQHVLTDADGVATAGEWVLGDQTGAQSLTAQAGAANVQLAATATERPVRAAIWNATDADAQQGATLPSTVVQVVGVYGWPVGVPGIAITASLVAGEGNAGTATLHGTTTLVSDAQGQATFADLSITGSAGKWHLVFTADLPGQPVSQPGPEIRLAEAPAALSLTTLELEAPRVIVNKHVELYITPRDTNGNTLNWTHQPVVSLAPNGSGTSEATISYGPVWQGEGRWLVHLRGAAAGTPTRLSLTIDGKTYQPETPTLQVLSGVAATAELVAGGGQVALPGTIVPTKVRLRLFDEQGFPVPDHHVEFRVYTGNGASLAGQEKQWAFTDAEGYVEATDWKLRGTGGPDTLWVDAGDVHLTVTALAQPPYGPGIPAPSRTLVSASATTVVQGDSVLVTITPRDTLDGPVGGGHEVWIHQMGGPGTSSLFPMNMPATYNGDGTYRIWMRAHRPGTPMAIYTTVGNQIGWTADSLKLTVAEQPAGGDVIVIGSLSALDNQRLQDNAGNAQFARNLVNYTAPGTRAAGTEVLFAYHGAPQCLEDERCDGFGTATLRTLLGQAGYGVTDQQTTQGGFTTIPAGVKVVFVWLPTVDFSDEEVNVLKQFASEGGRVVLVGEGGSQYDTKQLYAIDRLANGLGFRLAISQACDAQNAMLDRDSQHQVTAGIPTLAIDCSARLSVSHAYVPLFVDRSIGVNPIASSRIDTTLLPVDNGGGIP